MRCRKFLASTVMLGGGVHVFGPGLGKGKEEDVGVGRSCKGVGLVRVGWWVGGMGICGMGLCVNLS